MLFAASAIATVAFALTASAAPLKARSVDTIYPITSSQYTSSTGAVDYDVTYGLASRTTTNGGADKSTLVTFCLPSDYSGSQYMCEVVFDLFQNGASAYGTSQVDVFTSLKPAWVSSPSWPSGNLRDQYLGRIDVVVGGTGVADTTIGGLGFKFPCSAIAGQTYAGEIVPVGDYDIVNWAANTDGPKILVTY